MFKVDWDGFLLRHDELLTDLIVRVTLDLDLRFEPACTPVTRGKNAKTGNALGSYVSFTMKYVVKGITVYWGD